MTLDIDVKRKSKVRETQTNQKYQNNIYKGKIDKTQQKSNVVFLEK